MKLVLEISEQDLKTILKLQEKEKEEEEKIENLDEYVFIPITGDAEYRYEKQTLILSKNGVDIIKIKIPDEPRHITKIIYGNKINIHNIVVLTGYALDEESLGLIQTLDPCDQVKMFLINGKVIEANGLSEKQIIFSDGSIDNKLYFLRKTQIDLNKDIKISLLVTSKPIRKTEFRRLQDLDNRKIKGLMDLYGVNGVNMEDIESLKNRLIDITWYYKAL
jgi:hypothetical protein